MKRRLQTIIISVLAWLSLWMTLYAQDNQKLAQTGFQFISVVSDARGAAMAEALTCIKAGSTSMFFNPAGMAEMQNIVDIAFSNNQWIADIQHLTLSVAFKPFDGRYGVIGFTGQYIKYGDFIGTVVDQALPEGYIETGIFSPHAEAVGIGYAKALTDRFSVGGHISWAKQDLGQSVIPNENPTESFIDSTTGKVAYQDSTRKATNVLTPLVFDFGTQFRTGYKSLVFGMSVRNFSQEMKYAYENFQLPLTFTLGISMDILDVIGRGNFDHALLTSIDISHYRDHPEQLKIGMEYEIVKMIALRWGYMTNADERSGWSFGLGAAKAGFAVDYSYTPYGIFNNVQRITARYSY